MSKVTAILAELFDIVIGNCDTPLFRIFKTVPNDELTLPVTKSAAGVVAIVDSPLTLIASDAFVLNSYEPVPSAKIPNIVPNDELICDKSSKDADCEDVICVAPKILYGDSKLNPFVELLAKSVG